MASSVGVKVTALLPRRDPAATGMVKLGMLAKSVPATAPSPVTVTANCVSSVNSELWALGNSTERVRETGAAFSATAVELIPSRNREFWSRMVRLAGLTS